MRSAGVFCLLGYAFYCSIDVEADSRSDSGSGSSRYDSSSSRTSQSYSASPMSKDSGADLLRRTHPNFSSDMSRPIDDAETGSKLNQNKEATRRRLLGGPISIGIATVGLAEVAAGAGMLAAGSVGGFVAGKKSSPETQPEKTNVPPPKVVEKLVTFDKKKLLVADDWYNTAQMKFYLNKVGDALQCSNEPKDAECVVGVKFNDGKCQVKIGDMEVSDRINSLLHEAESFNKLIPALSKTLDKLNLEKLTENQRKDLRTFFVAKVPQVEKLTKEVDALKKLEAKAKTPNSKEAKNLKELESEAKGVVERMAKLGIKVFPEQPKSKESPPPKSDSKASSVKPVESTGAVVTSKPIIPAEDQIAKLAGFCKLATEQLKDQPNDQPRKAPDALKDAVSVYNDLSKRIHDAVSCIPAVIGEEDLWLSMNRKFKENSFDGNQMKRLIAAGAFLHGQASMPAEAIDSLDSVECQVANILGMKDKHPIDPATLQMALKAPLEIFTAFLEIERAKTNRRYKEEDLSSKIDQTMQANYAIMVGDALRFLRSSSSAIVNVGNQHTFFLFLLQRAMLQQYVKNLTPAQSLAFSQIAKNLDDIDTDQQNLVRTKSLISLEKNAENKAELEASERELLERIEKTRIANEKIQGALNAALKPTFFSFNGSQWIKAMKINDAVEMAQIIRPTVLSPAIRLFDDSGAATFLVRIGQIYHSRTAEPEYLFSKHFRVQKRKDAARSKAEEAKAKRKGKGKLVAQGHKEFSGNVTDTDAEFETEEEGGFSPTEEHDPLIKKDGTAPITEATRQGAANAPAAGNSAPAAGSNVPPTGSNVPPTGSNVPPTGSNAPPAGNNAPPTGNNAPAAGNNAPAAGNNAPAAGNNAPAAGNNAPAAGNNAPPTGSNAPPTGSKAPPTGSKAPPTGSNAPPTGSNAPPTGNKAPPTGNKAPPTGSNAPPTGSNAPPTGSNAPPTGSNAPPTGSNAPPTGSKTQTAGAKGNGMSNAK